MLTVSHSPNALGKARTLECNLGIIALATGYDNCIESSECNVTFLVTIYISAIWDKLHACFGQNKRSHTILFVKTEFCFNFSGWKHTNKQTDNSSHLFHPLLNSGTLDGSMTALVSMAVPSASSYACSGTLPWILRLVSGAVKSGGGEEAG